VQGVFIEAFLTTLLVFTITVFTLEKTRAKIIAPVIIGLAYFTTELSGIFATGGSLNPARSLGPAVATEVFGRYHWIYYVGPLIGSLLAAALYELMKLSGYHSFTSYDEEEEYGTPGSKATRRTSNEFRSKELELHNVGISLV
jgi:aquaporin related protein